MGLSRGIQSQLHKDSLWVTGNREPKVYNINIDYKMYLSDVIHKTANNVKLIESSSNVPEVVARLVKLKIANHEESDLDEDCEEYVVIFFFFLSQRNFTLIYF